MATSGLAGIQAALGERYLVVRELGRGGMASVYLARDLKHERDVAVKVLQPELAASIGAERFLQEIQLAARFTHPNVLAVHDSGAVGGQLFYVMPYVDGESIRQRLRREKQLGIADAIQIAGEVASALDYAHRQGIVHRDVKPENILLQDGHAVVADFGIARAIDQAGGEALTASGMAVGTPAYMSPEQAAGAGELDGRTDVYALGCVLHEMLAGEPPFTGATAQAVIAKRFAGPPPSVRTVRPAVPPAVERVLYRALASVPADRFKTARDFGEALTAASRETETVAPPRSLLRRALNRPAVMAAFLLLAIAVGLVASVPSLRRSVFPDGRTAQKSIAVLPFVNLSEREESEYLSDGLTEELITLLARVEGLRVPARTSSFWFKGRNPDVRDVGDKLGVTTVLEGSVRTQGERLRVTAQLVNVRDGYQLWAQSYDGDLRDVLAVQQQIARAIVNALRLELGPRVARSITGATSADGEAHDLYLRGRYAWNKRSPESLQQAAAFFRRAIARDPRYARAYSGLADAYISMFDYGLITAAEASAQVGQAARRALELDPYSAEAHTSLAHMHLHDWNWPAAEREFRRALELDPSYAPGYHWYALALTTLGRLDEAVEAMQRARALDPLSPRISADLGMAFYAARRYDDAIEQERRTLEFEPSLPVAHWIMSMAYEQKGLLVAADSAVRRALEVRPTNPNYLAALARVHALAGRSSQARELLAGLETEAQKKPGSAFFVALVYTALGDRDGAFQWLERSIAERSGSVRYFKVEPRLDPLRSDPRFGALLRRVGLPP